jgi:branched-chain amino acid transport system substrate-binding protein
MNMNKWLGNSLVLIVIPLIIMCVTVAMFSEVFAAEPIKIGVIDAYSGPPTVFTKPALLGWKLAASEFNAAGGLNGRKIEILSCDDKLSPEQGVACAQELVDKGAQFLGGTVSSSVALAVSDFAKKNNKIFIVHVARSQRITGDKGNDRVFRACPNTYMMAKGWARYAFYKKYTRWYIIGEDYEYGHTMAEVFWKELKRLYPKVEKVGEAWPKVKAGDYTAYIKDIKAKKPSGLFVAFGLGGMIPFTKQGKKMGLFDKVRVFFPGMADPVFPAILKDDMPTRNAFGDTSYLFYHPKTDANKKFVEDYTKFAQEAGVKKPAPPGFGTFGGYCAAKFITEAIKRAKSVETEKVVAAMEGLTIQTPIGPMRMRACDHQAETPNYWGGIQKVEGYSIPVLLQPYDVPPTKIMRTCSEILKSRPPAPAPTKPAKQ